MTKRKRLTTNEKYPHGAEGVSGNKLTGRYCRGVFEATACVEKLAEYENAEEEGRLVILPCKVGDTLYAILHRRTLCTAQGREFEEYSCSGCEEEKCDSYLECFVWENKFATLEWIVGNLRKFGKTVFRTREEAEKALKEMKNG